MADTTSRIAERQFFADRFNQWADASVRARAVEEERQTRTLKPTVVLALGGTGCEIAARLKGGLRRYYRDLGELVDMVQFVALDTESLGSQANALVRGSFTDGGDYHNLGGFDPSTYLAGNLNRSTALQRWWDPEYPVAADTLNGCKRIRQLGRLCLYAARTRVEQAITTAVDRARALDSDAVRKLQLPTLGEAGAVTFYVVSGTCGGTGSGMFLDLCHLIRRVAVTKALPTSQVRAVLLMPTLYVDRAALTSDDLAQNYRSNGYAFLRELHHFILNGKDLGEVGLYADERGGAMEALGGKWRPANRFYLMDNLVAGKVIRKLDEVFTLTADALFHIIATPVGLNEEGRAATNFDDALLNLHDGKSRAFSSLGVSYVLYAAKTIGRSASAAYLEDLIVSRLLAPLTEEDRAAARERGKGLLASKGDLVDGPRVADLFAGLVAGQDAGLPNAAAIEKNAEVRTGGKPQGLYRAMDGAERTVNGLRDQAIQEMQRSGQTGRQTVLKGLDDLVEAEIRNGDRPSLLYTQQVLRELKQAVEQAEPEADRAVAFESGAAACKREVQKIESDWVPDGMQRKALADQVRHFADYIKKGYHAAVQSAAANLAREQRGDIAARLETAIGVLDQASAELQTLATVLADQAAQLDPALDESYLVATTQLVPAGGVGGAVENLRGRLAAQAEQGAVQLRQKLVSSGSLWALGSRDEATRTGARQSAIETLVEFATERSEIAEELRRAVYEVAELADPAKAQEVLQNMLHLADPTWETQVDAVGLGRDKIIASRSLACPTGMPKLPGNLEELGREAKPIDDRRLMVLEGQHAAPLHAVVGVDALRAAYLRWIDNPDNKVRPVHLSREWRGGRGLADVFPEARGIAGVTLETFARASFTEWLVKDKKHPDAGKVIEGYKEHGAVFKRGASTFYAVMLVAEGAKLRRLSDQKLNERGGRAEALRQFMGAPEKSAGLYLAKLDELIAWDPMRILIEEYLVALQAQIDNTTSPELTNQLSAEREALRGFLNQAER